MRNLKTGLGFVTVVLQMASNLALANPAPEPGKILYYGGPVLSHVKVSAVFWGSHVDPQVQSQMGPFYKALVESNYVDWLEEYNTTLTSVDGRAGTGQKIGRGSFAGSFTVTPADSGPNITQATIEHELENQIDLGNLPKPDENSLYMLHFPPGLAITINGGVSCKDWCADHEVMKSAKFGNIYYAMIPDVSDCGTKCGPTAFEAITLDASHEFSEAITDPSCPANDLPSSYPGAWLSADGNEIGDLCTTTQAVLSTPSGSFTVQGEWDNLKSACNVGPFSSP